MDRRLPQPKNDVRAALMFIHIVHAEMSLKAALRFDAAATASALFAALRAQSTLLAIPLHQPNGTRGLLTAWENKEALDAWAASDGAQRLKAALAQGSKDPPAEHWFASFEELLRQPIGSSLC